MPSTPSILNDQEPADDLLLLSGRDLEQLMEPAVALEALRHIYQQLADNRTDNGRSIGFPVSGGSIHVKAGLLPGSHAAFAAKVNVNLPDNWAVHRLPTIQGVVLLVDALNGRPLAIMESMALTAIRTAATTALAATFGARKDFENRSHHRLRHAGALSVGRAEELFSYRGGTSFRHQYGARAGLCDGKSQTRFSINANFKRCGGRRRR